MYKTGILRGTKVSHEASDDPSGVDAMFFDNLAAVEVAIHKQRLQGERGVSTLRFFTLLLFLAISA